jgi:outer membrane immunogenic protein
MPQRVIAAARMCVRRVVGSEAKLSKIASRLSGLLVMAASLASATPSLTTAADLASIYSVAPLQSVAFSWVGPYVGATLGYQWGNFDNDPTTPKGLAGGLPADFNWQNGRLGGQTEIGFTAGGDDMFAPWQFSNPWFGTAGGRAGIAVNGAMPFGSAGFAYGELTASTFGNPSDSRSGLGFPAGPGGELGFAQHWSAKAERPYFELDDRHVSVTTANNSLAANLVRLGLNYRF